LHGAAKGTTNARPGAAKEGEQMPIENVFASVPVSDLNAAKAWYEELLGRPPDTTPMPEVAERQFKRGGWLQVYALPERAGNGSFTLSVSDLDAETRKLDAQGIDTSNRAGSATVKTLMIKDPDGNSIALAEPLAEGAMAR
jgi:predicted enzyme related to lactoylglutathione lyase